LLTDRQTNTQTDKQTRAKHVPPHLSEVTNRLTNIWTGPSHEAALDVANGGLIIVL